jgi:tRNA U34 5-methylaminomethyl-2-thiouridine-forming methyltransferase MnmC
MSKHVLPALKHTQNKDEITVLDICFGLGFNTLATLYALKETDKKVTVYSPEFDTELIASLKYFHYPKEFEDFKDIITSISEEGKYESDNLTIKIYMGDARKFVRETDVKFDIVYQDAFSPSSNPFLWTDEYFKDIASVMREEAILTTYSISLPTRIALHENGLIVYLHKGEGFRASTLASKSPLNGYEKVNVKHKMACNPEARSLKDRNL